MTASVQSNTTAKGSVYLYICLSYKDPVSGKHRVKKISTGFTAKGNKRRAQAMIPQILEQYAYLEEYKTPEKNVLFSDYLKQWLFRKKCELKLSTFEGYQCHMVRILEYFDPKEYKLIDITSGILDQFFRWCLQYGKVSQKNGDRSGLAPRTVREYKNLISAAFDQAMIDGLVNTNPAAAVKVHGKRNKAFSEEDLFLSRDEISEMLRFLDKSAKYRFLKPMAFICVYYGLRRSELLGLTWDAVDFEKGLISIRQTVVRVKTSSVSDITKTPASRRQLNLFPLAKSCLYEVKTKQEQNRKIFGHAYQNDAGFVFAWEDGRPYDPDFITKKFKKAMSEFGRPTITLHKLRHTCASLLIEEGWDIKQVQYWLGHDDIQTTLGIYAHYNKQRLNAASNDIIKIADDVSDLFSF